MAAGPCGWRKAKMKSVLSLPIVLTLMITPLPAMLASSPSLAAAPIVG